jgi:hypothetical protein
MAIIKRGVRKLHELRDVTVDAAAAGDALVWDGTAWVPVTVSTPTDTAGALAAANDYTDLAVANLVNSSPEALDTLAELAAALGDDANFATNVLDTIATKADALATAAALDTKADNATVSGAIAALQDDVATALTVKADLTYVDDELAGEAAARSGADDVLAGALEAEATARAQADTVLGDALDAAVTEFGADIATLQDDVATALATKADTTYVDTQLATKANASSTTTSINNLQSQINTKADDAATTAALATKSPTTHNHTLGSLTGVALTSPANDDVLTFHTASGTWRNGQAALRSATVVAYTPGNRSTEITYDDTGAAATVANRTNTSLVNGDKVVVAPLTGGGRVIVAALSNGTAQNQVSYGQAVLDPQWPNTEVGTFAGTNVLLRSTALSSRLRPGPLAVDADNVLGYGAGAVVVASNSQTGATVATTGSVRVYMPGNFNTYVTFPQPAADRHINLFFAGGKLWYLASSLNSDTSSGWALHYWDNGVWSASFIPNSWFSRGGFTVDDERIWMSVATVSTGNTSFYYVDLANPTTAVQWSGGVNSQAGLMFTTADRVCMFGSTTFFMWRPKPTTAGQTSTQSPTQLTLGTSITTSFGTWAGAIVNNECWVLDVNNNRLQVVTENAQVTVHSNIFPPTVDTGLPYANSPNLVQAADGSLVFAGLLDATVVGGAATKYRLAVWRVNTSGSTRVWTSNVDVDATFTPSAITIDVPSQAVLFSHGTNAYRVSL